jgi:energy-coupling factor transporter transmembrane protein EcfT
MLRVILGDPERFQFLKKEQVAKSCTVHGEAVVAADFSSLSGAADLVHPVVGIVATARIASRVAVCLASASTIITATSSSVGLRRGATGEVGAVSVG